MNKLLVFAMVILCAGVAGAVETRTKEESTKVYTIYSIGEAVQFVVGDLSNVQFQKVACIRGKSMDKAWSDGKTVYLPIDKITAIIEFESYENYKEAYKKYYEKKVAE